MSSAPNILAAGTAVNWLPFVIMSDVGARTHAKEASKSAPCGTGNHPNHAPAVVLINFKRIVQKCSSAWTPIRIKRHASC